MQILVDADGCPVKQEVYRVAKRCALAVKLVANKRLQTPDDPLVEMVVVGDGFDAADDWIVEHAAAGDVVVTADIPLAARCLRKDAFVVGPTGRRFTDRDIGGALASRALSAHLRESGVVTGGPAPLRDRDRSQFLQALDAAIQEGRRRRWAALPIALSPRSWHRHSLGMERSGRAEEHDLVDRARAGDGEALRALLERHEASLRRRLDRSVPPPLRRRVSVADVMQETWLVAFRRIGDFEDRGDGAFDAWLAAIADLKLREAVRHHLLTEKRAGSREVTRGARPNSSAFAGREPSPSDAAIGEEATGRVARAMAGLPEDYREVLDLVQVEGLTLAGAAARMGRSYEAVKKLYGRAASRLARDMQPGREGGP